MTAPGMTLPPIGVVALNSSVALNAATE